ncbi:recombination-associated protein RdgC [Colwellia sp. MEBiC06753]
MWFKNLYFFAFTRPFKWTEQELEQHLSEHPFTPCKSTEQSHFGWVNALGKHGNTLVHAANGSYLLCARKEEKILPAPVIKEMLEERCAKLEEEHGRSATKKEKEQFKEDITFELLPRAFSRFSDTRGYISPQHNLIVVDSSSRGKAEDFLALLRKVLGTLPVTSFSPEQAPDEIMTDWITEQSLGENFQLGMEAEFNALGDDGAVIRVKNQDLLSDEIKVHIDAEKFATKIALEWDEALSCMLCDDLAIKKLKFFDVLHEQNDDIDKDDIVARLDADFALMTGEINRFIVDLLAQFSLTTNSYIEEE